MVLNRRRLLSLGGGAAVLVGMAEAGKAAASRGPASSVRLAADPTAPPAFSVRMPVPDELRPVSTVDGVDRYHLPILQANEELMPGLSTPVLGYGGRYVGPTIRGRVGRPVEVSLTNQLTQQANAHLHGGHTPSASDGWPMDLLDTGASQVLRYPNEQRGATLWYHDHSHQTDAELVYRGLHGFYLLGDDEETDLRLPSGPYDVPIMLTDAHFDATGAFIYSPEDTPNRNTTLANGRPQPYFQVAARKYRFRVLDASNMRMFDLSLGGLTMTQIGSDGGLLPAPLGRTEVSLSPGERADLVIDFSRYPVGTQLVLNDAATGPVLRFDVTWDAPDDSRVPDRLRPLPPIPTPTVAREFVFSLDPTRGLALINGKAFDPDRVDVTVRRGATEVWRIVNRAADNLGETHNFHIHLVQYRVLDRDGKPPLPGENGLKDTVVVPPDSSVRVVPTFTDFLGKYVYHCHMLEHSSYGMMGRMDVVA
jgi:FtsP/CotA-like multicopper oxidase with cupredoxin domain